MNARTGNDYSQKSGRFCEYDEADRRWGSATRLALEEDGNYTYPSHGYVGRHGRVGPSIKNPLVRWFSTKFCMLWRQAMPLYRSVPYPSLVPLHPNGGKAPWQSVHARDLLIAGSFGHRLNMGDFPVRLREKLHMRCLDANSSCTLVSTQNGMARIAAVFWQRVAISRTQDAPAALTSQPCCSPRFTAASTLRAAGRHFACSPAGTRSHASRPSMRCYSAASQSSSTRANACRHMR